MNNRIREIREARGLSVHELGRRVGTSGASISRYETGERPLTLDMIRRIARELECTPIDLIVNTADIERDEIEPINTGVMAAIFRGLKARGLVLYSVTTDSVEKSGVPKGAEIAVAESETAIGSAKAGDIVIVGLGERRLIRVLVGSDLVVTHKPGANYALTLGEPPLDLRVVGVAVREAAGLSS